MLASSVTQQIFTATSVIPFVIFITFHEQPPFPACTLLICFAPFSAGSIPYSREVAGSSCSPGAQHSSGPSTGAQLMRHQTGSFKTGHFTGSERNLGVGELLLSESPYGGEGDTRPPGSCFREKMLTCSQALLTCRRRKNQSGARDG